MTKRRPGAGEGGSFGTRPAATLPYAQAVAGLAVLLVAFLFSASPVSAKASNSGSKPHLCNGLVATVVLDGPGRVMGTSGDDVIWVGSGAHIINGLGGNDTICGGPGNDQIFGDEGNDLIVASSGNDTIVNSEGSDTLSFANAPAGASVDLSAGVVADTGWGGTDTVAGVENLIGSPYDDTVIGDGADNVMSGGRGDDLIIGNGGNDTLKGGRGRDVISP